MDQIAILLQFEPERDYKKWKEQCNKLASSFDSIFLRSDETQLEIIFRSIIKELKKQMSDMSEVVSLRVLALSYIYFSFKETFDLRKGFIQIIESNFLYGTPIIVHCTGKLIYKLGLKLTNISLIWKKLINNASLWIKNATLSCLWYSSLVILSFATKSGETEAITVIRDSMPLIVQLIGDPDPDIQQISIKTIKYFLRKTFIYINKSRVKQNIINGLNLLKTSNSAACYGIIKALVVVDQSSITIDDQLAQEGCDAFFNATINCSYPTDYCSCQLLLKLCKKYSIEFDMYQVLNCLLNKPIQFVPLIEEILLNNYIANPGVLLIDFMHKFFKVHENDLNSKCQGENCPFKVLRAFYEICPEIDFELKPSIRYFCRHYCQCIELKPHIFNTGLIPELKRILFDEKENEELRISAIIISRYFANYFYADEPMIVESLKPFFLCPHEEIRKEIIKSLSIINRERALDYLINYATMDPSKEVRLFAINKIKPSPYLASKLQFFQCLNDTCFRVRRKAIKLTINVLKYNQMQHDPLFYNYYNKMAVLLLTSLDSKFSAKVASLFPAFFYKLNTENIYQRDTLAVFTISLILNILGPKDKTYEIPMMTKNNINKLEIFNLTEKNSRKAKFDLIIRDSDIVKRDGYLLKTLAKLGQFTEPYLNDILETFCYIFENRHSESLFLTAVKSLTKFSSKLFHGLNIRLRCPQIISPLLKIALTAKDNELGIALLKLFGSAFDSIKTDYEEESSQTHKIPYNPDDPYFYTDFVISTILTSFPEPVLPFFKSLAMILESDSVYAAKFIKRIVLIFMEEIDLLSAKFQKLLFSYMMVFPFKYRDDMESLLDSFTPFILKHIKLVNCVSFASALSYRLKFSFIPVASSIFGVSVNLMNAVNPFEYFKELLKLNALMVIYQNQPFELFLNQISMILKSNELLSNDYIVEILNILIGIVQLMPDVHMAKSRLAVMAHEMIKKGINPLQMIFSLSIFTKTPPSFFISSGLLSNYLFNDQFGENEEEEEKEHEEENHSNNNSFGEDETKKKLHLKFEDVVDEIDKIINDNKVVKISEIPFLKNHQIVVEYIPLCPKFEQPSSYFLDIDYPNDLSLITNWTTDLLIKVVELSPSATIRACRSLIDINSDFGLVLLPIAFYSCWSICSTSDQKHFSNVVDYILLKLSNIPDTIFDLMEVVDRWGHPLDIDIKSAAKLCNSQQYSILLIERYLKNHPTDSEAIDFLIEKYIKMGKISTARALFRYNEKLLDKMTIAKWSGKLGDWNKSLEIYKEIGAPTPAIFKCLVCLRKVDEIVDYYSLNDSTIIEEMTTEELSQMAASLLWAYYKTGNDNVILPFMKIAKTLYDPSCLTIFTFYELKKLNFDMAQSHVDSVFQILNEWVHHVYPGDAHQANIIHNYAQLFVEAEDAITFKKLQESSRSNDFIIKEDWEHRITGFKRETSSWEMFILLRNLILPIETNIVHYLKIIANLRKYRQFVLINDYFTKAFDRTMALRVLFERIKVVWEAGDYENAALLIENISTYIANYSEKTRYKKMNIPNNIRFVYFQTSFLNCFVICPEISPSIYQYIIDTHETEKLSELYTKNEEATNDKKNLMINYIFDHFEEEANNHIGTLITRDLTSKLKSSIYRTTASYLVQIYGFSYEKLKRAEKWLKASLELSPSNSKCWVWWGYINAQLFFIVKSRNNSQAGIKQSSAPSLPQIKTLIPKPRTTTPVPHSNNTHEDELLDVESTKTVRSYTSTTTKARLPLKRSNSGKINISLSDDEIVPKIQDDDGNSILTPSPTIPLPKKKQAYIPISQRPFLRKQPTNGKRYASVYDSDVLLKARERTNLFSYDKQNNALFLATGGSFTGRSKNTTENSSDVKSLSDRPKDLSSSDSVNNEEKFEVFDDIGTEKAFGYAMNSINGFLKAIQIDQKMSLTYLCKMFSVVFCLKLSREMPPMICRAIEQLPTKELLKVVPQITSHIDHQDKSIQSMITSILYKLGEEHFQNIFFPLKLYSTDTTSETRSKIASDILFSFLKSKAEVYKDANLFREGMINSAITWFESWITTIESVIKIETREEEELLINEHEINITDEHDEININENLMDERIKDILIKQLDEFNNPKCDLDNLFKQYYQPCANEIRSILHFNNKQSEKRLCDVLKSWYQSLKSQFSRLSCILLEKVSRELSAKRHFSIFVPGEEESKDKILSIHPILEIIGTQQRPRCLFINSESGKRYKYLLKGNEDIRVDERLMQFFTLVNIIMRKSRMTRGLRSLISCYTVIPLSKRVGIIGWVQNADTMHHLIKEYRYQKKIEQQIETITIEKKYGVSFLNLNFLQRLEVFNEIIKEPFSSCEEINEIMWMKSTNAASCLRNKRTFTETSALMSMVGYVIGLGDRHPNNIMIQRDSGNVVHIDFGESFDSTLNRRVCPEKVPFRLTRMIINTLEGKNTHGLFMDRCSLFMGVMRENQNSLSAQLAIFADDPVFDNEKIHFESSLNFNRKIYDKLVGYKTGVRGQSESVSDQVKRLIEQAEAPENYVKHYPGWCPFW